MSSKKNDKKNGKKREDQKEIEVVEETTFIVMILRPTDPVEDKGAQPSNFLAVLTGWCVIAAHGLDAAMSHVAKIAFVGVNLHGAAWRDVVGGKTATLADGKVIQVLPAPLYIVEQKEPLVVPPYIM